MVVHEHSSCSWPLPLLITPSEKLNICSPTDLDIMSARRSINTEECDLQAQLTQEVKRADILSAELERQQDDSSRGMKSNKRGTGDILAGRAQSQGGPDPLIPASRLAGGASTAGSELELLRRKLKVCTLLVCFVHNRVIWTVHLHEPSMLGPITADLPLDGGIGTNPARPSQKKAGCTHRYQLPC